MTKRLLFCTLLILQGSMCDSKFISLLGQSTKFYINKQNNEVNLRDQSVQSGNPLPSKQFQNGHHIPGSDITKEVIKCADGSTCPAGYTCCPGSTPSTWMCCSFTKVYVENLKMTLQKSIQHKICKIYNVWEENCIITLAIEDKSVG